MKEVLHFVSFQPEQGNPRIVMEQSWVSTTLYTTIYGQTTNKFLIGNLYKDLAHVLKPPSLPLFKATELLPWYMKPLYVESIILNRKYIYMY